MRAALAASLVLACACGLRHSASTAARVEVQIGLCSEPGAIVSALGLAPAPTGHVEVWYFDDPSLTLFGRGLVFRLRVKPRESELTMKVADQDCARVPRDLIPPREGKCEYDLHGKDLKGAVSLGRTLDERTRAELVAGRLTLPQVLGPAQVRYLREAARVWPLADGLRPLGPVRIDAYSRAGRPFVVEVWRLPSGRRFVEISRKVAFEEASRARTALESELASAGVRVCLDQASQARAKLEDLVSN
jgi:hypothetical protein